MSANNDAMLLFDFEQAPEAGTWRTVDDAVMGGRSESSVEVVDGVLVFSGQVSLQQDGGFCSTSAKLPGWDLSDYAGLTVTIRTGDRSFTLTARDEAGTDTVGHHHPLPVTGDEWQTVHGLFADFEAVYHGRVLEDHPGLDTARVRSIGFLTAEQEGEFRLQVKRIAAFNSG